MGILGVASTKREPASTRPIKGHIMPESAMLLDGRHLVDELRVQLVHRAAERREELGRPVRIALIAVGDDPTAALYAGQVARSCLRTGLDCLLRSFPADTTED